MRSDTFAMAKGHGTENDFVVLPDPDGTVHGDLEPAFIAALCDRRAGIGADGVLRVVRTGVLAERGEPSADPATSEWFMDYRNADGSVSEMCGNGVRVFAAYLIEHGWADASGPIPVGTRDGVKTVTVPGPGSYAVDMGVPELRGESDVSTDGRTLTARHVETGNPHAVAFVDDLADAGALLVPPTHDAGEYPHGVNVELVRRSGERAIAMRVHERGAGETRSCGTGAVAAAVATMAADGLDPRPHGAPVTYAVGVPGGDLEVTWRPDGHAVLTGPAVLVADGTLTWTG